MTIRDIARDVDRWRDEGQDIALATVIQTWGSGPCRPGAKMAVTRDARITGSVSGGCVESAVVEEGREVLDSGKPKLLHFGVADETAWEVGLSCGGTIEIFVEPLTDEVYVPLRRAFGEEQPVARATIVKGEALGESVVVEEASSEKGTLVEAARRALEIGRSERVRFRDGSELFVDVELPPPTLVMVGGVHVAVAMTTIADTVGYRTVVVDPRAVFGSDERFSHVGKLVREWPDDALRRLGLNRSTAVTTLTHDPKLDDPALEVALPSDAFYVGALGSKRTQEKRRRRLIERGVAEEDLERLRAPIGLPIGSHTPEQIALSIMAQIVAARNGVSM